MARKKKSKETTKDESPATEEEDVEELTVADYLNDLYTVVEALEARLTRLESTLQQVRGVL